MTGPCDEPRGARPRTAPRRRLCLLSLLALMLGGQSCAAYQGAYGGPEAAPADAGPQAAADRRAAFAASPHRPRNLLVDIDFERAEVQPVAGREDRHARLRIDRGGGHSAALGVFYEGGSERDRFARIDSDPQNRANRVLHYWLRNARVEGQKKGRAKGRIQLDLGKLQLGSVFQRYRLYLHPDLEWYRRMPAANGWFTINELWMGARWRRHPYPFRLALGIAKPAGAGQPLYFIAAGEVSAGGAIGKGNWESVWTEVARNFEIPLGEWLDIEMGYRQGDRRSGRFYLAVRRQSDSRFTTLFDVRNWTYHPDSPQPVALSDWQPLKLYTHSRVIDFVRRGGGVTQLYFDDLEIYRDW